MTSLHGLLMRARPGENGSILVLVLFMCLAVAVVIQTLSVVVACSERALLDETAGRARMEEKDAALAVLRQFALTRWEIMPETIVRAGTNAVEGSVVGLPNDNGWLMKAVVRQSPTVSRLMTSAWLERGRDGLDLPLAALVARTITATPGRELPWLEAEPGASSGAEGADPDAVAVGHVLVPPPEAVLGGGCSLVGLPEPWRLDPGWRWLESRGEIEVETSQQAEADREMMAGTGPEVAPGSETWVLEGRAGGTERLPQECGGRTLDSPVLIVLVGGADLDARDQGDVYGVIVVDEGGVLLDGTTLYGAVFTTESVSLGGWGRVVFSRSVLRWATDRSLDRARLVPGTRWEGRE